jgi:hypothetical protein
MVVVPTPYLPVPAGSAAGIAVGVLFDGAPDEHAALIHARSARPVAAARHFVAFGFDVPRWAKSGVAIIEDVATPASVTLLLGRLIVSSLRWRATR